MGASKGALLSCFSNITVHGRHLHIKSHIHSYCLVLHFTGSTSVVLLPWVGLANSWHWAMCPVEVLLVSESLKRWEIEDKSYRKHQTPLWSSTSNTQKILKISDLMFVLTHIIRTVSVLKQFSTDILVGILYFDLWLNTFKIIQCYPCFETLGDLN